MVRFTAGEKGWVDSDAALKESVTCIVRAGADIVITYGAERLAKLLR